MGVKFINIAAGGSIYALILIADLDLQWAASKLIGEVPHMIGLMLRDPNLSSMRHSFIHSPHSG
jgi:hypothetical protein